MKIDMRRKTLSITKIDERKRMIQSKMTSMNVLRQILIMKIENEFDEEEALQTIINESEKKESKKRR
jgi:hypothetical protein